MFRRFSRRAASALVVLFLGSCSTEVNLTLHNPAPFDQTARVTVNDKNGVSGNQIPLGTIAAGQDIAAPQFKVRNGASFLLKSYDPDLAEVFSQQFPVGGDPSPLPLKVSLSPAGRRLPDDTQALQHLQKAFAKLGPENGLPPLSLRDALATRFGALVVLGPDPSAPALLIIPPNELGVHQVTLEEFVYPDDESTDSENVSGTIAANAKASVPVYGSFGFNFSSSSVYQLEWTLRGFGPVAKRESDVDYMAGFGRLSSDRRNQVMNTLNSNPGSKLVYLNTVYAVKLAQMTVKEGQKLGAGAQVSAISVVTASGAYDFSRSQAHTESFQDVVTNFWGDEVAVAQVTEPASLTGIEAKLKAGGRKNTFLMIDRGIFDKALGTPKKNQVVLAPTKNKHLEIPAGVSREVAAAPRTGA